MVQHPTLRNIRCIITGSWRKLFGQGEPTWFCKNIHSLRPDWSCCNHSAYHILLFVAGGARQTFLWFKVVLAEVFLSRPITFKSAHNSGFRGEVTKLDIVAIGHWPWRQRTLLINNLDIVFLGVLSWNTESVSWTFLCYLSFRWKYIRNPIVCWAD